MVFNDIIWGIDPELFHIGSLTVRWYGLMFALAFASGYLVFTRALSIKRLSPEMLDSLLIYMALGTIIGARLGHCLFYEPEVYLPDPIRILKIWEGGLASHGAAIGIVLTLWLYIRKYKLSFLWLMDRIVIVVPLGGAFIRTGNLFNSEIYGRMTEVPWAFIYENDLMRGSSGDLIPNLPSHPTQLYEALSYLLLFAALFVFYRMKKDQVRDGFIFGVFLIALFVARFLIEFVKNDQVDFESGMTLNMGQWLSVPFILIGIALIIWTKFKPQYFSKTPIPEFPEKDKKKKKS